CPSFAASTTTITVVSTAGGARHPGLPTSFVWTSGTSKLPENTPSRWAGSRCLTHLRLSVTAGGAIYWLTSPGPRLPWRKRLKTMPRHPQANHHPLLRSPPPNCHPLIKHTGNPCTSFTTSNHMHTWASHTY